MTNYDGQDRRKHMLFVTQNTEYTCGPTHVWVYATFGAVVGEKIIRPSVARSSVPFYLVRMDLSRSTTPN